MPSSFICNLVHFTWSTSGRRRVLEESWRDRLYGYLGGILEKKKSRLIAAGGVADHVHVFTSLPATVTLAEIAGALKANSSRWIHETIPGMKGFDWQDGYGAFSVSKSGEARVTEYVHNQEEHHRERTFQEEFVALLEKHNIPYDERYLWV